jgi:hypothetical protein
MGVLVLCLRADRPGYLMKSIVLSIMLLASGTALAQTNSTLLNIANGKIVVAQSYCKMCGDQRTDCVVRCNGSGACIQNCDVDYQLCTERACQPRR